MVHVICPADCVNRPTKKMSSPRKRLATLQIKRYLSCKFCSDFVFEFHFSFFAAAIPTHDGARRFWGMVRYFSTAR